MPLTMDVRCEMETVQEPVQTMPKRRRSQEEKVGRLKYIIELEKRHDRRLDKVEAMLRTLLGGLHDFMSFDKDYVQDIVCVDEVDQAILQRLLEVGDRGILPRDLAKSLPQYKIMRWHATRRIQRMNKRLRKELGQSVAEKRGHKWAMTSFMHETWGSKMEEIREEE